ncbi:DUF3519 domain-containing protein [Helicobacter pylori]|nr:DUF3519 domain-containing protein [Helicobacter pylori]
MKLPKALNEATAGAALKYHLKRALERSHTISEFSKNLELSAQNAKFSNNTLKIIEELTNGIKQASEEIKEKAFDFSNEKLTNEQIKELLNNAEIPTSGRDAITFGTNNLNPEMVEFLHKNNKKMIIEKASNKELELLKDANFKHPENIRASLDHDAITHILKRHGVNSVNVKNGESPITYEDIANYRYIVNNADAILRTLDNEDKEVISAFKQINGYAVVVEQALNKKNELVLKTMYKSNGDYKDNNAYKKFSSTLTLNADAKVNHGLSSHSGATDSPTQKPLTSQEDLLKNTELNNETTPEVKNLSPLEQANAEKLAKLESEALQSEQEFLKAKEQEKQRKEALKKKLEHERGNAGNIESQTKIEVGEDIPTQIQAQIPKSRVRLNEREIYDLDYAIVKAKDLKPSFTTGGTQKRTDMNEEQIKSIAEDFDPKKIFGSGGFEDLPIILADAILRTIDKYNQEAITAFKQINGYAVVVEQAVNKKNELVLKTMYKNNGSYKNNNVYKEFSSTSLDANTPVPHGLSSHSGATDNPTPKPLNSQEDLLKRTELNNETTQEVKNLSPLEQANAEKLLKLQHAITPLKEFGKNYPEFALKPKEALEKLLQERNGQVAGAAYREDLGGIDFVWGNKDYGLEHILEKRKKQYKRLGLTPEQAKERTNELIKEIPNIIQKGFKEEDKPGYAVIILNNSKVVLSKFKGDNELKNHYMITSFEVDDKVLRELETIATLSNDYRDGINYSISNLIEPNPTTNAIKTQEPLSPLEQANAEKLAKLESEALQSEQEFLKAKEQEKQRKEALKKKLEHERGNAGNIESQTKIEVGEDIPTEIQAQIPKSRVRLNEREIYDLDYAIVKAKDLKPSFTTGGTQKRTDMNEEQIKSIAEDFDPKKIFGSGGFEDLPIILHDGQVIAGNHRIQGMLNFTPKSRYIYNKAIKEYYHIDLKPDELLVRVPHKRLDNTEINNLAASSNQGRFNSESDHAIAVLSHYEAKLKELDKKLDADSIYSLKNIVAKNLNFDKATHPNVGDSNLALLMFNMPRTKTQGIELLNRWQKEFSNDIKSYEKVKKMFVDNAGSFHNLIHDMNFPKVSLNAYLSDIMDRSFANLKNYQSTSESLKDLSEKFYKTSSLDMFEKSDQATSDISEILGGAIARFARFDDPSNALFEALKSDNIKKGLKEFKIADVTKDMFDPKSKEFKDIDIYDFTHYLLMVNREPNENNPVLNRLIEAVKDMQKESEKGIKKQKLNTPSEWGENYSEFKGDGLGAINKLLETKKGFVAGAFYKEGLGDIDLVWGTPKTKESVGYGLAHIIEKREKQYKRLGLTNEQAKKRTKELLKQIPEVIEKGIKDNDYIGHATIRHNGIEVGLSSQKGNTPLKNHYMITSFETDDKVLRELETIGTLSNDYRDGINYSASDLNGPNPTTNALKTQEHLSPLEQANAEKLAKLETEKETKAEAVKKLDFDEIKKLIDESPRTGSSMPILGMQNFTAEAVEYIHKNHKRIAVEKIEPNFAKDLKLKYPDDARAVIDYQAINHILKEHKNLAYEDIANYRELSKQANETLKLKDNQNRPVVASFNQINGFFVVVEQVSNAKNELMLKTMYKARGNYKDSLIYKKTLAKSQNSN